MILLPLVIALVSNWERTTIGGGSGGVVSVLRTVLGGSRAPSEAAVRPESRESHGEQ